MMSDISQPLFQDSITLIDRDNNEDSEIDSSQKALELQPLENAATRLSHFRQRLPTRNFFHKFWVLEALSSIISIILFISIIIVLKRYNNQVYGTSATVAQKDEYKLPGIYPALSFTSAVMRASMLLPVATAIGQLKWSWFRTRRRLIDVEVFDEASRGMLGSLHLLWTVRFRHWAAIGAALMIFTLPIDAIIQTAVLMPQRELPNTFEYKRSKYNITDSVRMPKIVGYYGWQVMQSDQSPWATTAMINAAKFGIAYGIGLSDGFSAISTVDCPTGSCVFGKYQKLAINSRCEARNTTYKEQEPDPYWMMPGTDLRLYANGSRGNDNGRKYEAMYFTTASYKKSTESLFVKTNGPLIVRTAIMAKGSFRVPVAMECFLYWSVNTYYGEVDESLSSDLREKLVANVSNFEAVNKTQSYPGHFHLVPDECWVNNKKISEKHDLYKSECHYEVGFNAHYGIRAFLQDKTDGLTGDSVLLSENENGIKWSRTNDFGTNIQTILDRNKTTRKTFFNHMETLHGNIAAVMTTVLTHSESKDPKNKVSITTGQVNQFVFYYKIAWARLILPAILVLASATFVLVTALRTRDKLQWKRSNLPLLFHNMTGSDVEGYDQEQDLGTMERTAEKTSVRLVISETSVKLC